MIRKISVCLRIITTVVFFVIWYQFGQLYKISDNIHFIKSSQRSKKKSINKCKSRQEVPSVDSRAHEHVQRTLDEELFFFSALHILVFHQY